MFSIKKLITPTSIVILVCLAYVVGILLVNQGDPKAFILLGTRFSEGDPQGSEGYDGQFAYQIALDPSGAAPYLDVPAYRYQRILYPMTARLLAFGQPALIPWTLIIVNIGAIALGTWATDRLLRHLRVNRWYALVYGLFGAQLLSLRADLNEPLAHAFVQLAMLAWALERRWWAVAAFGLAALGKETTLVFLAAYMLYTLLQGDVTAPSGSAAGLKQAGPHPPLPIWVQGRTGLSDEPDFETELTQSPSRQPSPSGRGSFSSPPLGGIEGGVGGEGYLQKRLGWTFKLSLAALPFIAYQLFLWIWLGSFGIGSGGAGATPFSLIPLGGWLAIINVSFVGFLLISLVVLPMSILPSLSGVWLSVKELWQRQIHPFVFCLLLNSVVILFLPTSTFREPVAMLRLTMGLVAAMLIYSAWRRSRRALNYSTFWIFTNVLLINGVA